MSEQTIVSRVNERNAWLAQLRMEPELALNKIKILARNTARNDRSDPFTYNRVYNRLLSGAATPEDYEKRK